ncbi:hypothetical protein ABT358_02405 [Streptomyces sp. NPDC000341]|uniref:hypothetical protein n=1 Tax=Streptomyces sp. NPDC000341 TaxID=3156645 RepID=UPI00331A9634
MSNDNVAVLTTLNGAVLLIGTVQYTKLMQRAYQQAHEVQRQRYAKMAALMDAKRRGEQFAVDDLLELKLRHKLSKLPAVAPMLLASIAWFGICYKLLASQLQMLVWIGTANAGPEPALAEDCFQTTAIAIGVLVAEGYVVSIVQAARSSQRAHRTHRATYTIGERSDLRDAVKAARRPTPAPTPSPPTGSPGPVA